MDEEQLHDLRKRVKRQRYATEFFTPVLGRRAADRYLTQLSPLQDAMGVLNDLYTARDAIQPLTTSQPTASFAIGWLAARTAVARDAVTQALGAFAKTPEPGRARRKR
jgi:triphosphatase